MTVGERVRLLRDKKTLAEFAENLGVSGSQISAVETGKSKMSFELAEKICSLYDCTMDWLIRGIGERRNNESNGLIDEPKSEYVTIKKDELIELLIQANKNIKNENESLKKQNEQAKNIESSNIG